MNLDINKFRKNLLDYLTAKKKLFLKDSTIRLAQYYLSKKYKSFFQFLLGRIKRVFTFAPRK